MGGLSAGRILLILLVDAGLVLALGRLLRREVRRRIDAVALIGVLVLPAALLLTAGLTELAGRGGSEHLLLTAPAGPPRPIAAQCRIDAAGATQPRRCRAPDDLRGSWALVRDVLRTPGGDRVALAPDRVAGKVDRSEVTGRRLRILGWALAAAARRPVQAVVVFLGERSVGVLRPTMRRPDVAQAYGPAAARSGFAVELPAGAVPGAGAGTLRVVGVRGAEASLLALDCRAKRAPVGC